jgi:uncharacterized membrane protein YbhN (UPF0104 family)
VAETTRRTALKLAVSVPLLVALAWFLCRTLGDNWASISTFRLLISWRELAVAFGLGGVSFLLETRAWQRTINAQHRGRQLGFLESLAVVNTSGLLKYLPGRVWTYGAQMLWLGHRGVSNTEVVQVNLVCFLYSALTAVSLGVAYCIVYVYHGPHAWVFWGGLVAAYFGGVLLGPKVLATLLARFGRLLGTSSKIEPLKNRLMLELAFNFALSWLAMGVAGYHCGRGVGLAIGPGEVFAIISSMSLASIVGYVFALTPGGIGVREALMLLILKNVTTPQAAIVLPISTRLLHTIVEIAFGIVAGVLGLRMGLFVKPVAPQETKATQVDGR